MLEKYFVQKITKLSIQRNNYGDYVTTPGAVNETLYCRFRLYAEGTRLGIPYEEQRIPFAEAWFKPSENVNTADIFLYDGEYWEVVRVRKARKGMRNDVSFLKVDLTMHTMVS